MRTMHDSTNPADLPGDTQGALGYINGIYGPAHAAFGVAGWDPSSWDRFTSASAKGEISVYPTGEGNIGDVEPGCIWPVSEAPTYVMHCRADGRDPTIYCDLNNWPAVRQAMQAAGLVEPHYWIALWDEMANLPWADALAKQYDHPPHSGGHYDLTFVPGNWPGVDMSTFPGLTLADQQALIDRVAVATGTANATDSEINPAYVLGIVTLPELRGLLVSIRDAVVTWEDTSNPQLAIIHTSPLDAKLAALQTTAQAAADGVAAVRNQLGVIAAEIAQLAAGGGGAGGGGPTLAQIQGLTDPLAQALARIEAALRGA
jgi:hypothetical protein